jgi:hypothetical protein
VQKYLRLLKLTCNLLGGGHWEDRCLSPAWAKSLRDPISTNGWMHWCTPAIPAIQKSTNGRTAVQVGPAIKWSPISKITSASRAGGAAQVDLLPCKYEALYDQKKSNGVGKQYFPPGNCDTQRRDYDSVCACSTGTLHTYLQPGEKGRQTAGVIRKTGNPTSQP